MEDRSRSKARVPHDRSQRLAAKRALKHAAVKFSGDQARAIGRGFAALAKEIGLAVWACAVLPDHVHLVVGRSDHSAGVLTQRLKGDATRRLMNEGLHPFRPPHTARRLPAEVLAAGRWKVYLFDVAAVHREIKYVEDNPLKEGKKRQSWSFVTPFSG